MIRRLGRVLPRQGMSYSADRGRTDDLLAMLARARGVTLFERPLVDATWDNPHFWLRYAFIRAALGLASTRETAVLGPWRARECDRTLERFGVGVRRSLEDAANLAPARDRAAVLLAATRVPEDILSWELPNGFPAVVAYDALLKRQRSAVVDLRDQQLPAILAQGLRQLAAAERIVEETCPDVVVVSHAVGFQYAGLVWAAVQRGLPVILATGDFGVPRFARLTSPAHMFETVDRPSGEAIAALPPARAALLEEVGAAYLRRRLDGRTSDVGGQFAFQRAASRPSRAHLCRQFGWDPSTPIVAVYAANWFDYPHGVGMSRYRDFLDWLEVTLDAARAAEHVNWIFRAHPCDEWYRGVRLQDLVRDPRGGHVRLAPTDWNGAAVQEAVDALVSVHSTAGIEYAAAGKPVLLADRGWYHEVGFATLSSSRADYLMKLGQEWWSDVRSRPGSELARIFAGWFFGRPSWQRKLQLADDSQQDRIYLTLPDVLESARPAVEKEIDTIRRWLLSDSRHYNTFKVAESDDVIEG